VRARKDIPLDINSKMILPTAVSGLSGHKIPEKAPKNENRSNSIDLLVDRPKPFFVIGAPR
jgi:hypothetical protein